MLAFKVILFMLVCFSCIAFLYFIRRERILESNIKAAYRALDYSSVKRARNNKKNVMRRNANLDGKSRFIKKPYDLFIYSRLNKIFTGLTFELWLLMCAISAAVIYFVVMWIAKSTTYSVLLTGVYLMVIWLAQKLLAYRNYKAVDKSLLEFLNLLENFSITSTDITSIFLSISRYLPDPLQDVLEECYYDAQTCGDSSAALYAMSDKLEHPKFKEIISNIEICINYAANYTEIIKKSREVILADKRYKRERKDITIDLSFHMVLLLIVAICVFAITDMLITRSIWHILFFTPVGKICMVFTLLVYAVFYYKISTVER